MLVSPSFNIVWNTPFTPFFVCRGILNTSTNAASKLRLCGYSTPAKRLSFTANDRCLLKAFELQHIALAYTQQIRVRRAFLHQQRLTFDNCMGVFRPCMVCSSCSSDKSTWWFRSFRDCGLCLHEVLRIKLASQETPVTLFTYDYSFLVRSCYEVW